MQQITDKDRELIALLQKNARRPIAELARELKVTRSTVRTRLERLERMGVVEGYALKLSDQYLGQLVEAIVMLKLNPKMAHQALTTISGFPEVTDIYSISGDYDCIITIRSPTSQRLDEILIEIRNLPVTEDSNSSIILTKWLRR